MTTVEIDIEKIKSAITKAEDLTSNVNSQRAIARSSSPISLPSLGDDTLGKKSQWLTDHLEDLTMRRDLAILLDTEGTGGASYTVSVDSARNVRNLLATELATQIGDIDYDTESEDYERIMSVLGGWQDDPEMMAAMFTELGPDGTVAALNAISTNMGYGGTGDAEMLTELATQMRTGLSSASNHPTFPDVTFGEEIVRYSVVPLLTDEERRAFEDEFGGFSMNGANILTFLMEDTTYSDGFLLSAANQLDEFEQMAADGPMDATIWYGHNGHGPLPTGDGEFDGWYDDPMAAVMHNLGEHPEVGLSFFTGPAADGWDRENYYFEKRDWRADGFGGITHALEAIGTSEANLENDPEATTRLVSSFFSQIADNDEFNPDNAGEGSPYLAELMKFYMPAIDTTLNYGNDDGDPRAVPDVEFEHLGTFEFYPAMYRSDLDALMHVAMSTQDGTVSIAEGIAVYQQTQVNNIAAELALDPDNLNLRTELVDTLQGGSALQGFAEYTVGSVEIDGAASRDAQRQAFLDALSSATSLVPLPGADAVGDWGSKLIKYGFSESVRLGKGEIADSWTNEAASVADDATVRAEESLRRVKVDTFITLVDSGIITEDQIPARWLDDRGRLIDPADVPYEDLPYFTQSAMDAVDSYISDSGLDTPYKNQFIQYYDEASR